MASIRRRVAERQVRQWREDAEALRPSLEPTQRKEPGMRWDQRAVWVMGKLMFWVGQALTVVGGFLVKLAEEHQVFIGDMPLYALRRPSGSLR